MSKLRLYEGDETLEQLVREVVNAPSLEAFKLSLDEALSNPIQQKLNLPMEGVWTGTVLMSLLAHSMILCTFNM